MPTAQHVAEKRNGSEFRLDAPREPITFLQGLKPQEIEMILSTAKFHRFAMRCIMTSQGEPANRLFLLWKGQARYFFETENGKKLNLRPITPGCIFGGAALVSDDSTYLLSSEALQHSDALVWESATIRAFAKRYPLILQNALLIALDHFSWHISAYAALSSQTARQRLARVLVTLAPAIGQKVLDGIQLDITNEELADSANITLYTASRLVSQLKKTGALHKRRGKILLRSPEKLLLRAI